MQLAAANAEVAAVEDGQHRGVLENARQWLITVIAFDADDLHLVGDDAEFGYSTYAFLDAGRIAVISQYDGRQSLKILDQRRVRQVQLPCTSIKPYLSANGNQVALIASSPVQTPSVVVVDVDRGTVHPIVGAEPLVDPQSLSQPEQFVFTTRDGAEVHGLFYPPWNPAGARGACQARSATAHVF